MEDSAPCNLVHGSCLWLVTDSLASPERLRTASHRGEFSVPCVVAVSGVGLATNRCTAYRTNVEAKNLCPRASRVNNCSCKKRYMNANILTEL